jgi:hypothetical protein
MRRATVYIANSANGTASLFPITVAAYLAVLIAGSLLNSASSGQAPGALGVRVNTMNQSVIVSKESFASAEPRDIVESNISFVNALLAGYLHEEEIPRDALRSYYADYYLAEVENGGFSQFVYNSGWSPSVVTLVREGLSAMKAGQHLKLFNESAAILGRMAPDRLKAFLEGEYFGTNEERDALDAHNDRFQELLETEDLIALNAAWLRSLPGLQVMTADDMRAEAERRAAGLPDREERRRAALENEPRYMKLMRALSLQAGQVFSHATAGDPTHQHNGKRVLAWHFITSKGHHYMVEADGKAVMFDGETKKPVVEMSAP